MQMTGADEPSSAEVYLEVTAVNEVQNYFVRADHCWMFFFSKDVVGALSRLVTGLLKEMSPLIARWKGKCSWL
jgi:hypothetical protein